MTKPRSSKKLNAKSIEKGIREKLGELSDKDEIALQMLSQCIGYYNKCVADLDKSGLIVKYYRSNGTEATKENMHMNMMLRLQAQISKYLTEFGMTPKSRERIKQPEPDEKDPFQEMVDKVRNG
jgi:P27 family predicted phage terminase small subunit